MNKCMRMRSESEEEGLHAVGRDLCSQEKRVHVGIARDSFLFL